MARPTHLAADPPHRRIASDPAQSRTDPLYPGRNRPTLAAPATRRRSSAPAFLTNARPTSTERPVGARARVGLTRSALLKPSSVLDDARRGPMRQDAVRRTGAIRCPALARRALVNSGRSDGSGWGAPAPARRRMPLRAGTLPRIRAGTLPLRAGTVRCRHTLYVAPDTASRASPPAAVPGDAQRCRATHSVPLGVPSAAGSGTIRGTGVPRASPHPPNAPLRVPAR